MTHADLFSGFGAFSIAAREAGLRTVAACEIESHARSVYARHFPQTLLLGDICGVQVSDIPEPVDVVTFGSPCFPAGTLVITADGFTPIEDVCVGDLVLTHLGRWRTVKQVGGHIATKTVTLQGQGHWGLECTPEHPFLSADVYRTSPRKSDGKRTNKRNLSAAKWCAAAEMLGKRWATPRSIEPLPVDPCPLGDLTPELCWIIGRWLGDGWVRNTQRPDRPKGQRWGQVVICCSHGEAKGLLERLEGATSLHWASLPERTVIKFRTFAKDWCNWLVSEFGTGASGKRLPSWVFGLPETHRQSMLTGYLSADGWDRGNGLWHITTVGKQLAFGLRTLAETLSYNTTLYQIAMPPKCTIEGRVVNQKTQYQLRLRIGRRTSALESSGHAWYAVKSVIRNNYLVPVYNLTVDEDNSYTADGFVVHNCQDTSIAGKRAGLVAGKRSGLFYEAIRLIRGLRERDAGRPRFAIWEQPPGVFSTHGGRDFAAVLDAFLDIGARDIGWRVLDAQYFGVPQRRDRIILVADLEAEVPAKYYLSPKACAGILRRAERRGKTLPPHLEAALRSVAGVTTPTE